MTNIWVIHHHNRHHSSRQDLLKNVIGDVVDVVWWDDVVCVLAASPAYNFTPLHHCIASWVSTSAMLDLAWHGHAHTQKRLVDNAEILFLVSRMLCSYGEMFSF